MMKIQSTDLRECKAYWRFVKSKNINLPEEPTTPKKYCDALNAIYSTHFSGNDYFLAKEIENMNEMVSSTIIPTKNLDWLTHADERMCYWIWCLCRLTKTSPFKQGKSVQHNTSSFDSGFQQKTSSFGSGFQQNNAASWGVISQQESYFPWNFNLALDFQEGDEGRPYMKNKIPCYPMTVTEIKGRIVEFIDTLSVEIKIKEELVQLWQKDWGNIYSFEKFLWVDNNNEEQSNWLWSYISNNSDATLCDGIFSTPQTWFIPTPTTTQQKISTSIAVFDIWQAHPDTKKIFVQKMKKAWGQKKHRMKMDKTNRKAYSITMGTDAKSKLDEMALAATMNKNDFLESIILKEYRNFITNN